MVGGSLGYAVSVFTGTDEKGVIYVAIDSEREPKLSPKQAREVAGQLLEAADWMEANRDAPLRSGPTA